MSYISLHLLLNSIVDEKTVSACPVISKLLAELEAANTEYSPKSESRLVKSKRVPNNFKVTFANLHTIVLGLKNDANIRGVFQGILNASWDEKYYRDLSTIDSDFFKNEMNNAISSVSFLHPNDPNYVLLIKAVFALKYYIERARINHPLPVQRQPISKADAIDDFNRLKTTPAKVPLARASQRPGKNACDYFMEAERLTCSKSTRGALSNFVKEPDFIKIMIGYLHTNSISLTFVNKLFYDLVPSDFNAAYVKDLIAMLKAQLPITSFFNPTGGWSGRLVGAMATEEIMRYMETDPNTRLHEKKIKIACTYNDEETKTLIGTASSPIGVRSGEKEYLFNSAPVEDLTIEQLRPDGRRFDMVFYSPPYFDLEAYPDDGTKTQSHVRYTKIKQWLEKFLYKSIEQSYLALSDNGIFAINIGNAGVHNLPSYLKAYMSTSEIGRCFPYMQEYNYSSSKKYLSPVYIYRKFVNIDMTTISVSPSTLQQLNDEPWLEHEALPSLPPKKRFKAMLANKPDTSGALPIFTMFKHADKAVESTNSNIVRTVLA